MSEPRGADRTQPPPRPSYGRARSDDESGVAGEPAGDAPRIVARLQFTGDGSEYFRIWVVNLLLTLLTLGVYSAWAKVRKTRYFLQNTQLDQHAFDYHGDPRAILLGRIVALVLLVSYTFAFDISRTAGVIMVIVLCAIGPWLFMRAQRFRFANTSWRGIRFGFDANAREAYRVVLPPLLIWFSTAVATAFVGTGQGMMVVAGALFAAAIVTFVMVPWIHHRLKAYQHRRARYGSETFDFVPATRSFYAIYVKGSLLTIVGSLLGFGVVALAAALGVDPRSWDESPRALAFIIGGTIGVLGYLVAWPYFAARMQALVWKNTRIRDVRFRSATAAVALGRLTARNVLLTIVTAGLDWPYAAIAFARYRVECMRVESDTPLGTLAESAHAAPGAAAGDAAVEAFGLDIGL